ncbi:MAG: HAD family hydrolase [Acidobacteriota bacterium]
MSLDYRAVLFDLDGTLTPVPSVWQHLHEVLGLWERDAERHLVAFRRGRISYEEFCARDAAHWKGMAVSDLRAITDRIPYRPGAVECVGQIARAGLLVGVISTGLTLLAERVHYELNLAYTIANRLITRGGRLTGEVKVNVQHDRKGDAVDLFCQQFGVPHDRVITVGDSEGDISMFRRSGFSVALNPTSERTARAASVAHRGESLLDLVTLMPLQWSEPQ